MPAIPTDESPPPTILPIEVRSLSPRDLSALRRLDSLYRLDQPDLQLEGYHVLRAAFMAAIPGLRGRRPAYVARAGEQLVGFTQFQIVAPDQRWHLIALGASVGVFDAEPVWEALLIHGVRAAGLSGVKRLFGRLPPAAPFATVIRKLGWTPYGTEFVYAAHEVVWREPTITVRSQEPTDTWAIHQLYMAAVPRPVQEAEAYTSHHWEMRKGRTRGGDQRAGWLVEEGHQVIGYARTTERHGVVVLELLYRPDRAEIVPSLIEGALGSLANRRPRRVFCAVRGYQAEAATALEAHGFHLTLEQTLLIKYTTASVRLPVAEAAPFHVEVREKVPRRVPTLPRGQWTEGQAPGG